MRLEGRGTHLILVSVLLVVSSAVWSNLDGLAVRFGGTFGIPVSKHTFLLPAALKLGLSDPVPEATAGPIGWGKTQNGLHGRWLDGENHRSLIAGISFAQGHPSRPRFSGFDRPRRATHPA